MKIRIIALSIFILSIITSCTESTLTTAEATLSPTSVPPTSTMVPSSTPDLIRQSQQASLLYSQDFETGSADGLLIFNQANWNVVKEPSGNSILCNEENADWLTVHFGTDLWTNYAVEMRIKMTTMDSIAQINARINNRTEGYTGSLIYQYENANLTYNPSNQTLGESSFPAKLNVWDTFRMEAAGNMIKFFIDGQLIGETNDTKRTQGKAGFGTSPHTKMCVDDIRAWALTSDGQIAQLPAQPNIPPRSLSARLTAHTFPKLFYINQDWDPAADALMQSSYRDIILLTPEVAKTEWLFMGPTGIIRSQNPNAVILAIFSVQEYFPDDTSITGKPFVSALMPEWTTRDIYGKPYNIFYYGNGNFWTPMINLSTDVNTFIPQYINDTSMKTGLFDGIFYDGIVEDWSGLVECDCGRPNGPIDMNNDGKADTAAQVNAAMDAGTINLLNETRRIFPTESIITGNSGDGGLLLDKNATRETIFADLLNGRQIEGFLSGRVASTNWLKNMRNYYLMEQVSLEQKTPLVMANCTGTDYSNLRYVLASALMFDGYFTCTNSQIQNIQPYTATWWYDEYSVNLITGHAEKSMATKGYLGLPVSDAYNAINKDELLATLLTKNDPDTKALVWRRDFQNGIVLVNPSGITKIVDLNGTFRKILGGQDPKFNDGAEVTQVSLLPQSGIILLNMP